MRAHLAYVIHRIRESFWFLPALLTLAAGALSALTLSLDRETRLVLTEILPWSDGLGLANARLIMSTVAGSVITAASLVFSLTLVALTLATGQLGPRLLSLFMRDRMTQSTIGALVSTFVYSLLVLAGLGDAEDGAFVPKTSIFIALLLTLFSFAMLIAFIHHLANSLHADVVVSRMANELNAQIAQLLEDAPSAEEARAESPPDWESPEAVRATDGGYVQTIDTEALVAAACRHDTAIRLRYRAGQFVRHGETIAEVRDDCGAFDALAQSVCKAMVFGPKRTSAEDPEFSILAIVEIALRALSPGINDPHTARTCIDWLGDALTRAMAGRMPAAIYRDADGAVRLQTVPLTLDGFVDTAFNEIRRAAEGKVSVLKRLAEILCGLAGTAETGAQRNVVRRHAELLDRVCARSVEEEFDRKALRERLNAVDAALKA